MPLQAASFGIVMLTGTIYFVTYAYISFLLAYTLKRLVAGVTNAASADKEQHEQH